ncbi:MAG: hypothetical protein IT379_04175 [Deltaproteobacteria bacterium]|nr:hypothetical protein [Deltaproteobacteria bacterium]
MLALREVLERIGDGIRWLTVRRRSRMLVVHTEGWRAPLLESIAVAEHEKNNAYPFVILQAAWNGSDLGFAERTEELLADYEAMRDDANRKGVRLPSLAERTRPVDPAGRFADVLAEIVSLLPRAMPGFVVVLAPATVDGKAPVVAALDALIRSDALSRVRWLLVWPDPRPLAPLARTLASDALVVDARPDREALARDLSDALENVAKGQRGAAPEGIVPPETPTWTEPDPEVSRALITAEHPPVPSPVVTAEPTLFEIVRSLVLRAAAAQPTRPLDAIRLQQEAVERCYSVSRFADAVKLEVMLGTYVASAGYRDEACRVFENAREHAVKATLPAVASHAEMARGGLLLALQRPSDAASAYATAGRLAEEAGEVALATEGYRMAGDLAARAGLISVAADAWARALAVTTKTEPSAWLGLDLVDLGERLAVACETRGWHDAANALRERARAIEFERVRAMAAETTVPMRHAFPEVTEPESPRRAPLPAEGTPAPPTTAFPEAPVPARAKDRLPDEVTRTLTLRGPAEPVAERP